MISNKIKNCFGVPLEKRVFLLYTLCHSLVLQWVKWAMFLKLLYFITSLENIHIGQTTQIKYQTL